MPLSTAVGPGPAAGSAPPWWWPWSRSARQDVRLTPPPASCGGHGDLQPGALPHKLTALQTASPPPTVPWASTSWATSRAVGAASHLALWGVARGPDARQLWAWRPLVPHRAASSEEQASCGWAGGLGPSGSPGSQEWSQCADTACWSQTCSGIQHSCKSFAVSSPCPPAGDAPLRPP